MKKKYFRIILLLLFTVIISQKIHSQEIDLDFYVNEEKEKVVLPTFHNIELAFNDLNFAYNIKSKYGYTKAKGLFEKKTNNSYYAIKTSSEQLAFHCLPIDEIFVLFALDDYLKNISPSPTVEKDKDGITYIFTKKTNGVTLSVILKANVFGSSIFATIEGK